MRKITLVFAFTTLSFFALAATSANENNSNLTSEDLEAVMEREMLDSVVYIEEDEEVVLDFDTYFHLPLGFNAYEGMSFELNDIDYIEIEQ